MLETVLVALGLCVFEILVIVMASTMAKPSLVLRFLPEDDREAGKDHPEPPKSKQMITAGIFMLFRIKYQCTNHPDIRGREHENSFLRRTRQASRYYAAGIVLQCGYDG